jgi:signal peptidase II
VNRNYIVWKLAYLVVAAGVYLIDQTTKAWVTRSLRSDDMPIINGFLNLTYAQNPGVAFSMFDQQGDAGRWGLSIVALFAGMLVLYFFWRTPRTDDRIMGALALLLAGIAGNVTDRIRLGHVIDFIDVQFGSWHYPTFNVADSAICIGAGLLLIDMFLKKKPENRIQKSESQTAA